MPDSNALRQRRKRAHAKGDHHLCQHRVEPVRVTLAGGELDPQAELVASARRLAAVCRDDPANVAAAKELRETLTRIPGAPDKGPAGDSLEQLSMAAFGWTPGDNPELRELAGQMLVDHGLTFLRGLVDQVP